MERWEQWVEQWRTMRTKGGTMGGTIEQLAEQWRTMRAKGNIRWSNDNNDRNKENSGWNNENNGNKG